MKLLFYCVLKKILFHKYSQYRFVSTSKLQRPLKANSPWVIWKLTELSHEPLVNRSLYVSTSICLVLLWHCCLLCPHSFILQGKTICCTSRVLKDVVSPWIAWSTTGTHVWSLIINATILLFSGWLYKMKKKKLKHVLLKVWVPSFHSFSKINRFHLSTNEANVGTCKWELSRPALSNISLCSCCTNGLVRMGVFKVKIVNERFIVVRSCCRQNVKFGGFTLFCVLWWLKPVSTI